MHFFSLDYGSYQNFVMFWQDGLVIMFHRFLLQVTRVRNALAYATHKFFQENGFVWISSPIITASDCEGAGEQFCVTTLVCFRVSSKLYVYEVYVMLVHLQSSF